MSKEEKLALDAMNEIVKVFKEKGFGMREDTHHAIGELVKLFMCGKQERNLFALSKEVEAVLKRKAGENNWSMTRMLEWMVESFSLSTPQEKDDQATRKRIAREEFFDKNPKANKQTSWNAGFAIGWLHFQIRKSDSAKEKNHGVVDSHTRRRERRGYEE